MRRRKRTKDEPTRAWRLGAYTSSASPIVIGGCGRSGTTLMRVILDTHSRICCGPESRLFLRRFETPARLAAKFGMPPRDVLELLARSGSQAEFIDLFYERYCSLRNKPRWSDKTPRNVRKVRYLFEHFPNARFIHVIRDGRDVICSLRTHPRYKMVRGQLVETGIRHDLGPCIDRWIQDVTVGRLFRDDPRYVEVRYEELVAAPEDTLRRLFEFLGEPFEPGVLSYHAERGQSRRIEHFAQNPEAVKPLYTHAVARWRRDLTQGECVLMKDRAGPLLAELGYVTDDAW